MPDMLCGRAGVNYLLEAKTDKGKLTIDQEMWHDAWKGAKPAIVRSVDEALRAVGL